MLYPVLYSIQAASLSFQLEKCHQDQDLLGLHILQGIEDMINHSQFPDDTLLLGGDVTHIARKYIHELDL